MFSTPNILNYAGWAARANLEYAKRHGYAFKHIVGASRERVPVWDKVQLLREAIEEYPAVFWIDSDAAVSQQHISLDRWLQSDHDFWGCSDHPNGPSAINTGVMLAKSTPWAKRFLDDWWSMRSYSKYQQFAFEQQALNDLIAANHLGCSSRIGIEPAEAFNSVWSDILHGKQDTFVLHYMTMTSDTRATKLECLCKRVCS